MVAGRKFSPVFIPGGGSQNSCQPFAGVSSKSAGFTTLKIGTFWPTTAPNEQVLACKKGNDSASNKSFTCILFYPSKNSVYTYLLIGQSSSWSTGTGSYDLTTKNLGTLIPGLTINGAESWQLCQNGNNGRLLGQWFKDADVVSSRSFTCDGETFTNTKAEVANAPMPCCANNNDCSSPNVCQNYQCVAPPTPVNPCASCPDKCVNGKCVACTNASHCAPPLNACANNTCIQELPQPVGPCDSCPDRCVNGQCVQCTNNTQCLSPNTCNTETKICEGPPIEKTATLTCPGSTTVEINQSSNATKSPIKLSITSTEKCSCESVKVTTEKYFWGEASTSNIKFPLATQMLSAMYSSPTEKIYVGNEVLGIVKDFAIEVTPLNGPGIQFSKVDFMNCKSAEPVIDPCEFCKDKCVNNACVECTLNSQCTGGGTCNSNKCVLPPPVDPCASCKDKCVAGQCVECTIDSQCTDGKKCTSNKCTVAPSVDPCESCKDKCLNGACVECISNNQCRTNACINNRCTTGALTPQTCIFC